jgi:hypothetical protein
MRTTLQTLFPPCDTGAHEYQRDGIKLIKNGTISTYYNDYDYSIQNPVSQP